MPTFKKCYVCNQPVFSIHSRFCKVHSRLAYRMKARRFPRQAVEAVWDFLRVNGDICYYSGLPLVMDDIHSPFFCVFDHVVPLDPHRIVPCCSFVNEMKGPLSEKEFDAIILRWDDFIEKGIKFKKIRLHNWGRQFVGKQGIGRILKAIKVMASGTQLRAKPKWKGKHKKCDLCGKDVFSLQSKYCWVHSQFVKRLEHKKFGSKVVKAILDYVRTHGFVCYYTGMVLDITNPRSPWHLTFDRLRPGDPSQVVLTSALLCEMKADLTIEEFWHYIKQLARHIRYGTPVKKITPVYWYRLTPRELRLKSIRD